MTETKRIIITGATGLIGKQLCVELTSRGYGVVVFSRSPEKARSVLPGAIEYVGWNAREPGDWVGALEGAYGVVHLAGAPIFTIGKRWSESYKAAIRDSRITSTRVLVEAMAGLQQRPQVFVCGSGVSYYGDTGDTQVDENAPSGDLFLSHVTVDWEAEAARAADLGVRTVSMRTGIVLDANDGALPLLALPFRFYAGGPILPGTQYISWIHVSDEAGLIILALEDARIQGPLNAVAPQPETNADFTRVLGQVMKSPSWLPVPGFTLRVALGEMADNLVTGQRAIPRKALDHGYRFIYPTAEQALRNLL